MNIPLHTFQKASWIDQNILFPARNYGWSKRQITWFAYVSAAAMALMLVAIMFAPKVYYTSGKVIIGERETGGNASAAYVQKLGDPADLESQLLIISSARLLKKAIARPEIHKMLVDECWATSLSPAQFFLSHKANCFDMTPGGEEAMDFARSRYSVEALGRSRVISVGFTALDPGRSRKLSNALINAYLKDQPMEEISDKKAMSQRLWKDVRRFEQELRAADEKIQSYRIRNGLMNGANSTLIHEQLSAVTRQLAIARAKLADAQAGEMEMRQGNGRQVLNSPVVSGIRRQIATLDAQIASASGIMGPKHPKMRSLLRQRQVLAASLDREINRIKTGAVSTMMAAKTRINSLQKQMASLRAAADEENNKRAILAGMIRKAKSMRATYETFHKKASEIDRQIRTTVGKARLVSMADMPLLPVFPKKIPLLVAGIILSLILGFTVSLLIGFIENAKKRRLVR